MPTGYPSSMYSYSNSKTKEYIFLFIGDGIVFFVSLWAALFLRFFEVPSFGTYMEHMGPFIVLSILWAAIFVSSGLYERHLYTTSRRFLSRLGWALGIGAAISVFLFYTIPFFEITPKTVLGLFVICLGGGMWGIRRAWIGRARKKERALCIGSGEEMKEIQVYVDEDGSASFTIVKMISLDTEATIPNEETLRASVRDLNVSLIIIDMHHVQGEKIMQYVYPLLSRGVRVQDQSEVYEECFERIPISVISYRWIMERITAQDTYGYAVLKRVMDVCIGVVFGVVSLIVYPFVVIAIKLEDGGPILFTQKRVGKNNQPIYIRKFRTMSGVDSGSDVLQSKYVVTKVGAFLRATRLDELPQLWNVLRGDLSLIGPRPEIPNLVAVYEKEIPYYNARHLIKPGLSGWAQIYHDNHPHHGTDVIETSNKLSYDLYYITHRSLLLDIDIALKTIRIFLGRKGR